MENKKTPIRPGGKFNKDFENTVFEKAVKIFGSGSDNLKEKYPEFYKSPVIKTSFKNFFNFLLYSH